jgi:predicted  nucleic acid-binding Zn-ribbon protein
VATELESLLAVQSDDVIIHGLEERLAAFEPRIKALDARRQKSLDAIARTNALLDAEEKKQAYLRDKIAEHKQLIERNQAQMDAVTNMKMATAAEAQMAQAKKIVASEESDLLALNRRVEEIRAVKKAQTDELAGVEGEQDAARTEVASQRAEIDGELAVVRAARTEKAKAVPSGLLGKYDKIRGNKRVEAVFAMRDMSCGNCDTAIPMQRRHIMSNTQMIDLCEACGVLMYFPG